MLEYKLWFVIGNLDLLLIIIEKIQIFSSDPL